MVCSIFCILFPCLFPIVKDLTALLTPAKNFPFGKTAMPAACTLRFESSAVFTFHLISRAIRHRLKLPNEDSGFPNRLVRQHRQRLFSLSGDALVA